MLCSVATLVLFSVPYGSLFAADDDLDAAGMEMDELAGMDDGGDLDLDSLEGAVDDSAGDDLLEQLETTTAEPEEEFSAPGVVAEAADLEALLKKRGMGQEEVMKAGWGKILPAFASAAQGGMDRKKKAIEMRDTKLKEMDQRLDKVNKGITGARQLLARYQARFKKYTDNGDEPENDADRRQIFFGGALLEDLAGKDAKIEARYQDAMRRIADMETNMAAVMWRTFDYIAELLKIMNQRLMLLEEKVGGTVVTAEQATQTDDAGGDEPAAADDETIDDDDEEIELEDE